MFGVDIVVYLGNFCGLGVVVLVRSFWIVCYLVFNFGILIRLLFVCLLFDVLVGLRFFGDWIDSVSVLSQGGLRFGGFTWVWLFRDEFAGFVCNLVVGLNLLVCVGFGVFCFRGGRLVMI